MQKKMFGGSKGTHFQLSAASHSIWKDNSLSYSQSMGVGGWGVGQHVTELGNEKSQCLAGAALS